MNLHECQNQIRAVMREQEINTRKLASASQLFEAAVLNKDNTEMELQRNMIHAYIDTQLDKLATLINLQTLMIDFM